MQGIRAWQLPGSAGYRLSAPTASTRTCPSAGHVGVLPWALLTGRVSCGFKAGGGDTEMCFQFVLALVHILPSFLSTTWLTSGDSRLE